MEMRVLLRCLLPMFLKALLKFCEENHKYLCKSCSSKMLKLPFLPESRKFVFMNVIDGPLKFSCQFLLDEIPEIHSPIFSSLIRMIFLSLAHRRNACSCPAQSHFKDECASCPPVGTLGNIVYCSSAHIQRQHPQHVTELFIV